MKNIVRGAVVIGAFLLLTGCTTGSIVDKRVISTPGNPYDKVFQLRVDGVLPDHWVTVTEQQWDDCPMFDDYPACTG